MRNNKLTHGDSEVFRNLFESIAEEMGPVLRRTASSANTKKRRDYSCAVYDSSGETIAMGDHMPVHLGEMPLSVRHTLDSFDLMPGDMAIVNDPFSGGTHLPDITAVSAVFPEGVSRPGFYVANRAHHSDVGGMSPGSMPLAREICQEGLLHSAGPADARRRDPARRDEHDPRQCSYARRTPRGPAGSDDGEPPGRAEIVRNRGAIRDGTDPQECRSPAGLFRAGDAEHAA